MLRFRMDNYELSESNFKFEQLNGALQQLDYNLILMIDHIDELTKEKR